MPSQVSLTTPTDGQTALTSSFWATQLALITTPLNQLSQGIFDSANIVTTGNITGNVGSFADVNISDDLTVTDDVDINGDVDVDGTLETDAITLEGAAVNAASGLCKLNSSARVITANISTATALSSSFSAGTEYQNTGSDRKIMVIAHITNNGDIHADGFIGSASPAATNVAETKFTGQGGNPSAGILAFIVPPNYYWEVTVTTGSASRIETWELV